MSERQASYARGQMLPGTVYTVVRVLGAGGMGTVYEVEDTSVGKTYVLKTLHAELADRRDLVEALSAEARALARLRHRNIVDVITAGTTTDALALPYYVMERLEGVNLRALLARGPLPFRHVHQIGSEVLEALYRAHHPPAGQAPIIHRDIKPENVFLARDLEGKTVTKVVDFGIMAVLDGTEKAGFRGTVRYAAPEQLRGERARPASDLYAFGCVLYEMLTGHHPFADCRTPGEMARAHLSRVAPPLRARAAVPPDVERAVLAALEKLPERRPANAYRLMRALAPLARSLPHHEATTEEMLHALVEEQAQRARSVTALASSTASSTIELSRADLLEGAASVAPLCLADTRTSSLRGADLEPAPASVDVLLSGLTSGRDGRAAPRRGHEHALLGAIDAGATGVSPRASSPAVVAPRSTVRLAPVPVDALRMATLVSASSAPSLDEGASARAASPDGAMALTSPSRRRSSLSSQVAARAPWALLVVAGLASGLALGTWAIARLASPSRGGAEAPATAASGPANDVAQ